MRLSRCDCCGRSESGWRSSRLASSQTLLRRPLLSRRCCCCFWQTWNDRGRRRSTRKRHRNGTRREPHCGRCADAPAWLTIRPARTGTARSDRRGESETCGAFPDDESMERVNPERTKIQLWLSAKKGIYSLPVSVWGAPCQARKHRLSACHLQVSLLSKKKIQSRTSSIDCT